MIPLAIDGTSTTPIQTKTAPADQNISSVATTANRRRQAKLWPGQAQANRWAADPTEPGQRCLPRQSSALDHSLSDKNRYESGESHRQQSTSDLSRTRSADRSRCEFPSPDGASRRLGSGPAHHCFCLRATRRRYESAGEKLIVREDQTQLGQIR